MNLQISKDITTAVLAKWEIFINSHEHGTVLQSPFFYNVFKSAHYYEPVFIYCTDDDELVGILLGAIIRESDGIKGWFSSRLVVWGGPLICSNHPQRNEIFNLLLHQLILTTSKKTIFIQFRAAYDMSQFDDEFLKNGFRWFPRINLLIETTDKHNVIEDMSASRLRQVKKSFKSGAQVIEAQNLVQVGEFYELLSVLYKKKIKKPLPHLSFFESFFQLSAEVNSGKIFLVTYQQKVIGGILCPYMVNKDIYEWYVCGLDKQYNPKGIYPSVLATWAAIDFGTENKLKRFDFLGLGKPDVKYGVRDFKLKFGGSIVNYGRFIRINNSFVHGISELGYNILAMIGKI